MLAAGIEPNATLHHFTHPQVCATTQQQQQQQQQQHRCAAQLLWHLALSCSCYLARNASCSPVCTKQPVGHNMQPHKLASALSASHPHSLDCRRQLRLLLVRLFVLCAVV
jgi:hypothetical protein